MSWFAVRKSDNRILGWVRSSGATPANTAEIDYVDQNFEAGLVLYNQLENELLADGRNVELYRSGGTIIKAVDNRPVASIMADKTLVQADGIDAVTLTVTRIDNPTFNGAPRFEFAGKLLQFQFTNGVAVKEVRSRQSGVLTFQSNPRFRVTDPISIEFVE